MMTSHSENPNSALLWLPRIEAAGLRTPRTITLPYAHHDCMPIFDGQRSAEFDRLICATREAVQHIGYPAFIRTDLASAKHSGPRAYRANHRGQLGPVLCRTIEDNEIKFGFDRHGPRAILVREFLHLRHSFTAFRGLPIAREFRFFADAEHVFCEHPYWPEGALEDAVDGDLDDHRWRTQLAALSEAPNSIDELRALAIRAAAACGGAWSVDFAEDDHGAWWLIDMATMRASWHWLGCPNGTLQQERAR